MLVCLAAILLSADPAVLRWGGDLQGGEPYVYQDPKNPEVLIGFELEIAQALAGKLGMTQQFVQNDWTTLLPSLLRGTFDIAMNGLEETADRRGQAYLTRPYFRFDLTLSVREADKARYAETLPRRIGVLENSLAADWVKKQNGALPLFYQGVEEPYLDLLNHRLDGVLMDSVIEAIYGRKAGIAVARASVAQGDYVIACDKKNLALCERVDRALSELEADGTLKSILQKHNLWNDKQVRRTRAPDDTALPAAHFNGGHWLLFVRGAAMTLLISLAAMLLAAGWGLVLAASRAFGPWFLHYPASFVVELFRGTPVLLQLYVVYFGLAPYCALSPEAAAIITLGLNYGAYEAEIYRGGLNAVSPRQWDAALSLGLTRRQAFSRVVLPQAIRVALPGMVNDFVSLLKDSALVSVITVVELTKQMSITAVDVHSWLVPGAVCALLYMAMSLPASWLGRHLERRLTVVD